MRRMYRGTIIWDTQKRFRQKGIDLNHGFYVVVGKQCRTENAFTVPNTISLYKLTNVLLLFICFKFLTY